MTAAFVAATVRGLAAAGVASCLKHFPGHGDTRVDSHVGLPVLRTSAEQWRSTESIPFAAGIVAGADAVMIGHLCAPGLDPAGVAATFSPRIVAGLLRDELGFDGVIVTDAMDMAGARPQPEGGQGSSPGEACVAALRAGVDQILMPRDAAGCIKAVLAAVETGALDEAALRASAARILSLKERVGAARPVAPVDVDFAAHRRAARSALTRAITWRDRARAVALDPGKPVIVMHDLPPASVGRGVEDVPTALTRALRERGFTVEQRALTPELSTRSAVILVTRDAWRSSTTADTVAALLRGGRVDAVVCARSPYDSALVPEHLPVLFGYGDVPGIAEAVADTLVSGVALGSLPIDLPGAEASGRTRWPREVGSSVNLGPHVVIRPYRHEDREAIGSVCVRTGASGADATGHFFSDELLPSLYAYPYVEHAPELCQVVEADGHVVGYVLGVADVPRFAQWWAEHWQEHFVAQFPEDRARSEQERALVRKGREPEQMVAPWHDDHPAELHIDLLPVVQGMGLGRALIERFRALIRARGIARICLGVGGGNVNAVAFYRRLGFRVLREHKDEQGVTTAYTMWIPAQEGDDGDHESTADPAGH